jgi:hypothetical protein
MLRAQALAAGDLSRCLLNMTTHQSLVIRWLLSSMPHEMKMLFNHESVGAHRSLQQVLTEAEWLVQLLGVSLTSSGSCGKSFHLIQEPVLGWTPRTLLSHLAAWSAAPTSLSYASGVMPSLSSALHVGHSKWGSLIEDWELLAPDLDVFAAAAFILDSTAKKNLCEEILAFDAPNDCSVVRRPVANLQFCVASSVDFVLAVFALAKIAAGTGKQHASVLCEVWFDLLQKEKLQNELIEATIYALHVQKPRIPVAGHALCFVWKQLCKGAASKLAFQMPPQGLRAWVTRAVDELCTGSQVGDQTSAELILDRMWVAGK